MFKKKFTLGITIIIIFSLVIAINLWFNQEIIISLFSSDEKTKAAMSSVFSIFLGIVFLDGLQISLFGVLKTLYFTKIWRLSTFSFYFIGLLSAIFFAFYMQWQLKGIWCGWLLGIIVSLIFELKILVKIDLENDLEQIRENYKKDIDAIKERKFELSSYKRLS